MNVREVRKYNVQGNEIPPSNYASFLVSTISAYINYTKGLRKRIERGESPEVPSSVKAVYLGSEEQPEGNSGISVEMQARLKFEVDKEERKLRQLRTVKNMEEWLIDTSLEGVEITEENYKQTVPQVVDTLKSLLDGRYPQRQGTLPLRPLFQAREGLFAKRNPYEKTTSFEYVTQLAPAGFDHLIVPNLSITLTGGGITIDKGKTKMKPAIETASDSIFAKREESHRLVELLGEIVEHHYKIDYTQKESSRDNLDKKIK